MPKYSARELLEQICRSGPDAFGISDASLRRVTSSALIEAWNAATKANIVDYAGARGMKLEDHVVSGDYDISLWQMPPGCNDPATGLTSYGVAINNDQHNPLDPITHHAEYPGSSLRHLPTRKVLNIVSEWIDRYGQLFVGSGDISKLNFYERMFSKYFKIKHFNGQVGSAFFISNKTNADVKQESGYDCLTLEKLKDVTWQTKLRCLHEGKEGYMIRRREEFNWIKWTGGTWEKLYNDDELRFKSIGVL